MLARTLIVCCLWLDCTAGAGDRSCVLMYPPVLAHSFFHLSMYTGVIWECKQGMQRLTLSCAEHMPALARALPDVDTAARC